MKPQVLLAHPASACAVPVAVLAEAVQDAAVRLRDAALMRGDKEAAQVAEICLCLAQGIEDRELSFI